MTQLQKVSVHGGHSGQFCNHATDSLEDVVSAYIRKGFSWVGITEHAPAISDALMYEDQQQAGLTAAGLYERFGRYISECRRLQQKHKDRIDILVGMETETYSGYERFVPALIDAFHPDYLVGSVHFVDDINFDSSPELYQAAAVRAGGTDRLYERYFDLQYDMISRLRPAVVGHFDLIRIFDPDYRQRMLVPSVQQRIGRNLQLVKDLELILDFNLRSMAKGADEPYVTASILRQARELEVAVVPGDDSHGVGSVGNFFTEGVAILQRYGFPITWRKPKIHNDA